MDPIVSVYCLAYNHEKYIRDALEGFVTQKTNFSYEVVVHDDASTDNTGKIIKEYADKYPEIIKPIIQTENQYSKHTPIIATFIAPLLKGKYIAICEGDDYWCNTNKLQSQVEWLEEHKEYSACVHNTKLIDIESGKESYFNTCVEDADISIEQVLQRGGACFHTSSILYRAEYMSIPSELQIPRIGDYPRAVYMALCGKVRYLHDVMSVYRMNVEGSYTKRFSAMSLSQQEERERQIIQFLKRVDIYSNGEYKDYIEQLIKKREFNILLGKNDYLSIKEKYNDLYLSLDIIQKINLIIRYRCPRLIDLYHKIKNHET